MEASWSWGSTITASPAAMRRLLGTWIYPRRNEHAFTRLSCCDDRLRDLNKRFEKSPYDSFWCQEEAETKQFMLMHFKKREGEAWKFKTVEKRFRY